MAEGAGAEQERRGEEAEGDEREGGRLGGGDGGGEGGLQGELLGINDGGVERDERGGVGKSRHALVPIFRGRLGALPEEAAAEVDGDDAALRLEERAGVEAGEKGISESGESEQEQQGEQTAHDYSMAQRWRKKKVLSTGTPEWVRGR